LTILLAFSAIGIGTCCASLQQAVSESVDGCIIIMRGGTWNEHVVIDNDLTIIGGYGGGETVINGAPAGYGTGDNYGISDSSVFKIDYADVVLTGLTITDGNADTFGYGVAAPVPVTMGGGGILNIGGTLTLNDVTVTGNSATHGAGVYNDHGTVILNSGTTIEGNRAGVGYTASGDYGIESSYGGGIYNDHGTVVMNCGSSISGNSANQYGGGIHNNYGTVIMNGGSSISGNIAYDGGGIDNFFGTIVMREGSFIYGNEALYDPDGGGGITNYLGSYDIYNSNIAVYDNTPLNIVG